MHNLFASRAAASSAFRGNRERCNGFTLPSPASAPQGCGTPARSASLHLLAISGSLRARSVNTAVLQAVRALAPANVTVELYAGLGELPHFNPDHDVEPLPPAVVELRRAVDEADALVFCSPEYAHGVPGSLKNGLDWLVSFEGFSKKRVVLINARPGAVHAPASLRETLTVMDSRIIDEACVTLPLTTNTLDSAALLTIPAVRATLETSLAATLAALR